MDTNTIRKLALLLPENAGYPTDLLATASKFNVVQHCQLDPAFPWHFVQACLATGKRLPLEAREIPLIYRAYRWRKRNTQEPILEEAYGLTHPSCSQLREVLDALLLCGNLKTEEISGYLALSMEVITAYEGLWFNVRDRLDDKYFVAQLCHPGTRLATTSGMISRRQLLLEAAHDEGPEAVLFLAGLRSELEGPPNSEELAALETALVRQARIHLRGADRRDILQAVKGILIAAKKTKMPENPSAALQVNLGEALARELQARDDNYESFRGELPDGRTETPSWETIRALAGAPSNSP